MPATRKLLSTFTLFLIATLVPARAELRINQPEALRAAVSKPSPPYSPMAKQMRIEGTVEVEVHISPAGDVDDVKVLSGNPLLTTSVTRCLKDWKFTPFQQDGKSATAVAVLRFTFKL